MTTSENAHAQTANNPDWVEPIRQIEATLAVAYEQRTANIIAFLQLPMHLQTIEERTNAMAAVKERLNL